jgi:acetyl esterase
MHFNDYFRADSMQIKNASAEMRAFVTELQAAPLPAPPCTAEEFAASRSGLIELVQARGKAMAQSFHDAKPYDVRISVRRQDLRDRAGNYLLVIEPEGLIRGAMLHIHGGGWSAGSPAMVVDLLKSYAAQLSIVIATVGYRLAPEHAYPAAPDDCEAAALWWMDYCRQKHRIENIVISGESAGAHLSAVTAIRLRRKHDYRLSGAILTYGLYDFRNNLPSRSFGRGANWLHDERYCEHYAKVFVPDPLVRADQDASPLLADLDGMPPALFSVGTLDPLLDDSLLMHARWRVAGNASYLVIYKDALHGFDVLVPGAAEATHHREVTGAFMKACFAGTLGNRQQSISG